MSKQKYPQAATTSTGEKIAHTGREHYSQVKTHAKQDRKRHEAYARQDKYESMSLKEQLASCVPDGSKRQRARIEAAMAAALEVKPAKTPLVVADKVEVGKKTPNKSKVVAAAKAQRPSKS